MANETKYPWHIAPDWANYAATDANGEMYWYEFEPKITSRSYLWADDSQNGRVEAIKIHDDWKDSLEKRPDNA